MVRALALHQRDENFNTIVDYLLRLRFCLILPFVPRGFSLCYFTLKTNTLFHFYLERTKKSSRVLRR